MRTYLQRLNLPLSFERLASYQVAGDAGLDSIVRYLWNVELCEALYPTLNAAEIALRNSIHAGMASSYGVDAWFDDPTLLEPEQYRIAQAAKAELMKRGNPTNAGRVIAQLHFGFWVTMLSKPYESRIWAGADNQYTLLRTVFPHATRKERRRYLLYRRFADINALRNRVFHYEPVWDEVVIAKTSHRVEDLHAAAIAAIGWISPELRDIVAIRDRFLSVHTTGRSTIETDLRSLLGI